MAGNKTHDQQIRTFEHKEGPNVPPERPGTRDSAPPASRAGLHQENRDHNKHNSPGQEGHTPQKHSPAEEKH
jgi:hypothetical protein